MNSAKPSDLRAKCADRFRAIDGQLAWHPHTSGTLAIRLERIILDALEALPRPPLRSLIEPTRLTRGVSPVSLRMLAFNLS